MKLSCEEALQKARDAWGNGAWVCYDSRRYVPYVVGLDAKEFGAGNSWEEAFAEALARTR